MNRTIRAIYDDETICVYQAFNKTIALEAVQNQEFGQHFKIERMTWIKPSFLWMMYRSGWASKENQEHVLRITILREGFDELIKAGCIAKFDESDGLEYEKWREKLSSTDVRIQWDPERNIYGEPQEERSIQIGIKNDALAKYLECIVKIEDITDFVHEQKRLFNERRMSELDLPKERCYKHWNDFLFTNEK